MDKTLKERLVELDIEFARLPVPGGSFVAVRRTGKLLYVSGKIPISGGKNKFVGQVGTDLSLEQAQAAARLCAINILFQIDNALEGDFKQVAGCVRLGGYVNAAPGFTDHPKVINGASDLIIAVMGESGRHARIALGASSLPGNVAVEIEAIFELH